MELLLNINQYEYREFLDANVATLIIGLKDLSYGYSKVYDPSHLEGIVEDVHSHGKKIYLSVNMIANEKKIKYLETLMPSFKSLETDGFVVSDFGVLQLFKENDLIHKVIFNPITNITNNYSAYLANSFGIHHVCLANELNIKDILEITQSNEGNVEILAQGYYQICNSKRPLLTNFFNTLKMKGISKYYYIQEESRDYAYPIVEKDNETIIYTDKQRCILPYFETLTKVNIKYLRIDTIFMDVNEIYMHIDNYFIATKNPKSISHSIYKVQTRSNSNLECLDNISILTKEDNSNGE